MMSRTLTWMGLGAIDVAWLVGRKRATEIPHDEVDALGRVITSEADRYSESERTAMVQRQDMGSSLASGHG